MAIPRKSNQERPDRFLLPWAGPVTTEASAGSRAGSPNEEAPAYITARGRDLRVDVLRGYFVLAMVIDHIRGASPVQLLTGGNRFFTSAAEGFILTSGLMVGLVYRRIVIRDGIGAAARKALTRAGKLYLLTVGITLVLLPLSETLSLPWAQGVDLTHSTALVIGVLTLHRTYYLADVMLLYTLLFVLAPLALALMASGKTRYLLAASWLLWGLYQFFPDQAAVTWPIEGNLLFVFSSWQVLFFSAIALGFQRDRIPAPTRRGAARLQAATGLGFVLLVALYALLQMPATSLPAPLAGLPAAANWVQQYVFGKVDLRPGRLVASAVVFTFMFLTITRGWRWLGRPLERVLGPLGRNSLYAFTAHVVLVTLVALILLPFGLAGDGPQWLNALIQVGGASLIWLLTQNQVLEPTRRTQPIWQASPVVLALVAVLVLPSLSLRVSAAPPAATAAVSADVLARARAFGTPVARLNLKSATANDAQHAPAAGASTSAGVQAVPGAAGSAGGQAAATPVPATAGIAVPANDITQLAAGNAPAESPDATSADGQAKVAAPAATPTPQPRKGAAANAASGAVPPLPDAFKTLQSGYVGALAGHAYALSFHSDILNRDMPYWIYLPPDYGKTNQRYPVAYMLHGGGGTNDEWAAYGLLDAADKAFSSGKLAPFIIVLPEGEKSFWANWAGDNPRWGDYLASEVVGQVDANFATLANPASRAVGGLSAGGWGALYQGFLHPDIFGAVLASSPSFYPDNDYLAFLGTGAEYAAKDPIALARNATIASSLRIWVDIGQDDPWAPSTIDLHNILTQRGVPHDWHLYTGTHRGEYWASHVPDYLAWLGQTLGRA